MTERLSPSKRLSELIEDITRLYDDNTLTNTSIDKIKEMRNLYNEVTRNEKGHAKLLQVLVDIVKENKTPDICVKCNTLNTLTYRIKSDAKQDLQSLMRKSSTKKDIDRSDLFKNVSDVERRAATNVWFPYEGFPGLPESTYYVFPRMMFIKFTSNPIIEPQIVWDDKKGRFTQIDKQFREYPLPKKLQFFYNPSMVGFIFTRAETHLEEAEIADEIENLLPALDKSFIMLFAYFQLLGTDIFLQDIVTSNEAQLTNLFCALMMNDSLRAAASDEEDIPQTSYDFSDSHWIDKWKTLIMILLVSIMEANTLQHTLQIIKSWKFDKDQDHCRNLSSESGNSTKKVGGGTRNILSMLGF